MSYFLLITFPTYVTNNSRTNISFFKPWGKLRKPLRRPDGRRKGLFTHLYYATPYFVHAAATAAVQISSAFASPAATTSLT